MNNCTDLKIYKTKSFINILVLTAITAAVLSFSTLTRDLGLIKMIAAHLLLTAAGALLFFSAAQNNERIKFDAILSLTAVYIAYLFINFIMMFFFGNIILWPVGIGRFFMFFMYFIMMLCVYNSLIFHNFVTHTFYCFAGISAITVIYSYFQLAGHDFHLVNQAAWGSLASSLGNPQFYGTFIIAAFYFNLSCLFWIKNNFFRYLAGFNLLNFLIQLPYTEARSAWLGFFASIIFAILFIFLRFKKTRFAIVFSFAIIIAVVVIFSRIEGNIVYESIEKIKEKFSISYGTGEMRIETYKGAMRGIGGNYWTGIGIGSYQIMDPFYRTPLYDYAGITNNHENTHSEDLQVWEETGTIGIVLYYLILLVVFIKTIHYFFKHSDDRRCIIVLFILCGQIAVWIQNFVDVGLRFTSGGIIYWFGFALLAVLINESNVFFVFQKFNKNAGKNQGSGTLKSKYYVAAAIFVLIFALQIKEYIGMFDADEQMQTATSYERPDSKFYGPDNKEMPNARYTFLIDYYSKAIAASKYHYEAYYKLAHAYYSLNDFEKSREMYLQLQRYAPYYANLNFNLSLYGYVTKNQPWALYYMEREIFSNSTQANITRYYNFLKEFYPERDHTIFLRNALWIEDESPTFRSLLAFEYLNQKKYNLALDEYLVIATQYSEPDKNKHRAGTLRKPEETETLKIEAYKNAGVVCYNYMQKPLPAKNSFQKYIEKTKNEEERGKVSSLITRIDAELKTGLKK